MNPHLTQATSFFSLIRSLWKHRILTIKMAKREVIGRYKGSFIGLGWSFFHPLFMLAVYTFVFSVIFKARWGNALEESKTQFAVVLFSGLIMYNLFSEVLNRSSGLLLENINYVKKVIFPLEILPVIVMGVALFHNMVSLVILLSVSFFLNGVLHWTVLLIPIVFLPLIFITLGFSWMLASLGVYLRDCGQIIEILTRVMMFLTPIFYPISALPEKYQTLLMFNPLTFLVEQARRVLIFGQLPHWKGLMIYSLTSIMVMWSGYWWFQKTRKGFADVI